MIVRRACLIVALLLAGCQQPVPSPRYHLGGPYQSQGVWHYPAESYALDETGLAGIAPSAHAPLTTNGEIFDQTILAAAHPTLQLPAIARVTNLENGLSVLVRINDRGTGDPKRLVEVTRRTAELLRMAAVGRVRVEVVAEDSRQAVEKMSNAPRLAVVAAPRASVVAVDLAPPMGMAGESQRAAVPAAAKGAADAAPSPAVFRLPEIVTQGPARPGKLMVRLDTFEEYHYAAIQNARMGRFKPSIVSLFQGRQQQFRTEVGPFDRAEQAEAALDFAFSMGIPDARIVVE